MRSAQLLSGEIKHCIAMSENVNVAAPLRNYTSEEKAYHLKKMQVRFSRLDINKDGFTSREDFDLMAKKMVEFGKLSDEQSDTVRKGFMHIADAYDLKPGVKVPIDEVVQRAHKKLLYDPDEPEKAKKVLVVFFNTLDTNNDGHISVEEFKVYSTILTPGVSDEDIIRTFNVIDTDNDGQIDQEEYVSAITDFLFNTKETEISKAFLGLSA